MTQEQKTAELKSKLHLYVGAIEVFYGPIHNNSTILDYKEISELPRVVHNITPILRRLSSMTEEEARELVKMGGYIGFPISGIDKFADRAGFVVYSEIGEYYNTYYDKMSPAQIAYLLGLGFDLFDWIEKGIAKAKEA